MKKLLSIIILVILFVDLWLLFSKTTNIGNTLPISTGEYNLEVMEDNILFVIDILILDSLDAVADSDDITDSRHGSVVASDILIGYYFWSPQKDITAYELALLLPFVKLNCHHCSYFIEGIPPEARRHFRKEE